MRDFAAQFVGADAAAQEGCGAHGCLVTWSTQGAVGSVKFGIGPRVTPFGVLQPCGSERDSGQPSGGAGGAAWSSQQRTGLAPLVNQKQACALAALSALPRAGNGHHGSKQPPDGATGRPGSPQLFGMPALHGRVSASTADRGGPGKVMAPCAMALSCITSASIVLR